MNYLDKDDVINIFKSIYQNILINKELLTKLDSQLGDGDLGLTMETGFRKICDYVENLQDENNLGIFIKKLGFVMGGAVPSTMGTLIATAIIKSGEIVSGKDRITADDMPKMLNSAILAIQQRGKAKRGDKTILDALYPALEGMEYAAQRKEDIKGIAQGAFDGAKKGVEESKYMKSTFGKAAVYREKSIGKQDPGATVILLIFEAITNYLDNKKDIIS